MIRVTHDRAEEMDHGVLSTTLARRSRRSFLRAGREGASERSLRGEEEGRGGEKKRRGCQTEKKRGEEK